MRQDVDPLLSRAFALMADGQLAEAEQTFFAVVDAEPREHRARHALAVIALRVGRPDLAVQWARSAQGFDRRNPDYLYTLGIALGENGELEPAVDAFERALRERPTYPDAHCNLGLALRRLGRLPEALQALQRAVVIDAGSARAHVELGKAYLAQQQPDAALPCFAAALEIDPASPAARNSLGIAFQALGRLDEAIGQFRLAQAAAPGDPDPHNNEGLVLRLQGRLQEAEAAFRRAVELDLTDPIAANNLGSALQALGRLDAAAECLRAVAAAYPEFADAHANLGAVLRQQGLLDAAAAAFSTALTLSPRSIEVLNGLGTVRQAQGRGAEAIELLERARAESPAHFDTLTNLGLALLTEGRVAPALECLARAVELQPDAARAANNLASAYRLQGDLTRAVEWYRRAVALDPGAMDAHSNLLATLNYRADIPLAEILAEHRRFGERMEAPLRAGWRAHGNSRDPDRTLRIGYVSGDFREHAMAFSIAPVLAHHDAARVEIVCYANNAQEDRVTARLRSSADEWHRIVGLGDDELADLVRRHGIDILVDLAGHTALNRLAVFARRPAPVQAAWLGYATSTGLTGIDYRLTDARADPPGADETGFTERPVRLPWVTVFEPAAEAPEVAPLPSLATEPFTFGCLNHLSKMTPEAVALWARLLVAVPASRLLLGHAGDAGVQDRLAAAFAAHGVPSARLAFRPKLGLRDYLALHGEIDLALDTFPYNGGATSCHSLWMGVPIVTLAGDRYMARIGSSLLDQVGLGELIARTPDEYVDLAAGMARDRLRLAGLRASMRTRLSASPLLDAAGFVRSLEAAYRTMWQAWCRQ